MKYTIAILLTLVLALSRYIYLHPCDCKDSPIEPTKEIRRTDTVIHKYERGIEVRQKKDKVKVDKIKSREKADTIIIKTQFDSTATKNTVYMELIKCDSIGKERLETISELNELVVDKDSTIQDKDSVIVLQVQRAEEIEKERQQERKQAKKAKRKAFVRGFLIGAGTLGLLIIIL